MTLVTLATPIPVDFPWMKPWSGRAKSVDNINLGQQADTRMFPESASGQRHGPEPEHPDKGIIREIQGSQLRQNLRQHCDQDLRKIRQRTQHRLTSLTINNQSG